MTPRRLGVEILLECLLWRQPKKEEQKRSFKEQTARQQQEQQLWAIVES